uniref:Protein Lines C-terminal domain-containing protein n=1 Tax=Oryza punctata TaxID=4537 RepID=A0A0E0LGH3_ORYPU
MARRRRRRERQQLARLCDLVAGSLLPHLEPKPPATRLRREDEQCILLALSRVSKAIRGWEEEDEEEEDDDEGCESDQEIIPCSAEVHSCSLPANQHFDDVFSCLANITSILEIVWIQYVELVWIAVRTVSTCAHSALPSSVDSISSFRKDSICYSSVMESLSHDITISSTNITSFMEVLQLRCLDINGHMVASLFRVLHSILKFLKHTDSELKNDFICISVHHILMVDWDSYYQINVGEPLNLVKDSTFSLSDDLKQLGFLSSSLLQLLCSLLEQSDLEDSNGQDICAKLVGAIPKLVAILPEHKDAPKSLSQYLKHKFLMIMMRLKPYIQKDCSYIVCCLKLLRRHFQHLLHEPIMQHIARPENCLEGSPFLLSIVWVRLMINPPSTYKDRLCICFLAVAYVWLTMAMTVHCNVHARETIKCFVTRFKTAVIIVTVLPYQKFQAGFRDDDMLFNVLLQLLDAPLISLKIDSMEIRWASELIGGKLFSSIFDPVHLHYDHLVLVDYLISKDVGVHCVQYLLRCLRLVTQCWHSFIDDSIYEAKIEKLNFKRQKTFNDANSSSGSSTEGPKLGSACDKKSKNKHKLFLNAKACLLSLKRTLEDLHKKGLFPYNPKPLLKRPGLTWSVRYFVR